LTLHNLNIALVDFHGSLENMKTIFYENYQFGQEQQSIDVSNQKNFKSSWFLRWWLTIGYYSFCVPFQPVLEKVGNFKLEVNTMQKVSPE